MCRRNRRINADRGSHEAPAPSAGTAEAPVASAPRRRALKAAGAGSRPDQQQTKSPARLREIAGCRSNRRRPTRSESGFRLLSPCGFRRGHLRSRGTHPHSKLAAIVCGVCATGGGARARAPRRAGQSTLGPLCCTSLSKSTRSRRATALATQSRNSRRVKDAAGVVRGFCFGVDERRDRQPSDHTRSGDDAAATRSRATLRLTPLSLIDRPRRWLH